MRTVYVEFLKIADYTPIDQSGVHEEPKLNESAQFLNHIQALLDARREPGSFYVNIAANSLGQFLDLRHHVLFRGIQDNIRA